MQEKEVVDDASSRTTGNHGTKSIGIRNGTIYLIKLLPLYFCKQSSVIANLI